MDLKLYVRPSEAASIEHMDFAGLETPCATGVEILANKVVKFLLTTKGSDALDPEYGSTAFSYTQVSKDFLQRLRIEIQRDITRCFRFIKSTESSLDISSRALLGSIILRDVSLTVGKASGCTVKIEIVTTSGTTAILDI